MCWAHGYINLQAKLLLTCIVDDLTFGMASTMEPATGDEACVMKLLVDLAPCLIWAYEQRTQVSLLLAALHHTRGLSIVHYRTLKELHAPQPALFQVLPVLQPQG